MTAASRSDKLLRGATGDWEVVVGMEVHAQVQSKAKLFSGAATSFGAEPNSHVSLVDAAMPGMLPVINRECVAQAVRTGLGLKAKINLVSRFDRKNYFYPDLPQGYQISQYQQPIVGEGTVTVDLPEGGEFRVGIERLHLEQDAGKSLHDQHATLSYVDLNRAGVALMEIVTRPDIRSADEAKAFLTKLRSILRYLGTSDADMEKGNLRADVNVSVRRPGEPLGTRCEIKNVNSIRFVGQAIEHEARRQIAVIEEGGTIAQQTRLFDPAKRETRPMRSKEEAHDYRYFPDPDLLPLELNPAWIQDLEKGLPEMPDDRKQRFIRKFDLLPQDAARLVEEKAVADFFEETRGHVAELADASGPSFAKRIYHWVTGELFSALNAEGLTIDQSRVSSRQLAGIILLERDPEFGRAAAEAVFFEIWSTHRTSPETAKTMVPRQLAEARGLRQVTDTGAIAKVVDDILAANPDKVAQAREKPAVLGWFVGQVMKASGGKANPQAVNALLRAKLGL